MMFLRSLRRWLFPPKPHGLGIYRNIPTPSEVSDE